MKIDSGTRHQTLDLHQTRYNPAMRRIWPWPVLLLEKVAKWIKELPGNLWLDAACGEGQLGQLVGHSKKLIGLDVDSQRLLRARSHLYRVVIQGSITSIPLADATLSGIASVETLEHVPDIDRALQECSRCLRRHGYLVLTVPSVTLRSWWQMHRTKQPVYCDEKEHVRELSSITINGFPNKFETWQHLTGRLESHGFKVVKTGGVGFVLPTWHGRLAWIEHAMNLLYHEAMNRWLGKIPGMRNFPSYRMYLLQNEGKR